VTRVHYGICSELERWHRRQGPICTAHKTYAKPSTFVKYAIKFAGSANSITNFELAEEYVRNNKRIKYFKFFVRAYQIPHLEFVSHAAFECAEIAKPFIYLYYLEQYASTAYLDTYLDFFMVTQSIVDQ
jgi:hypothetical protein